MVCPDAGIEIGLQFKPYAHLIGLLFRYLRHLRMSLILSA